MAVSLTLHQVRSSVAGGYKVENTITAHTTVTDCVFVFASATDVYDHVASIDDIIALPETKDPRIAYYRKNLCSITYAEVDDAISFASDVKSTLHSLVNDYSTYITGFIGSEDTVIT